VGRDERLVGWGEKGRLQFWLGVTAVVDSPHQGSPHSALCFVFPGDGLMRQNDLHHELFTNSFTNSEFNELFSDLSKTFLVVVTFRNQKTPRSLCFTRENLRNHAGCVDMDIGNTPAVI
jgi:hypothetical protein